MQTTAKDLIKILPFEQSAKDDLLQNFDGLDADRKYAISDLLWDTYYTLYELKFQENFELALLRAMEGKEVLDKDFYKRVREHTRQEMEQTGVATVEGVDLDATRKAMEMIVKEIRSSKKTS